MLFNSFEFIFLFLPLTALGFYLLRAIIGWQNYLAAATGLKVFTYNVGVTNIKEWLRKQPAQRMPKYLIFQRIERRLSEAKSEAATCQINLHGFELSDVNLIDASLANDSVVRPVNQALGLQTAIHWLKSNLRENDEVLVLDILKPRLFSNAQNDKILVYKNDFLADEKRRQNTNLHRLACYLEELRQLAEANGRTKFLVVVAPDKYTAYRKVTRPKSSEKDLFMLLADEGVPLVRFDRIFQAKVAEGVQDLYLPNDTHWGSEGNRLFASVIAELIKIDSSTPSSSSTLEDSE